MVTNHAPPRVLLALILLLTYWNRATASLIIGLDDGAHQCFTIPAPKDVLTLISTNYVMMEEDLPATPLRVELHSKHTNSIVYESNPGDSKGYFTVSGLGTHELCFWNGWGSPTDDHDMGDNQHRTVGFTLRVRPNYPGTDGKAGPVNESITTWIESSLTLQDKLLKVLDHMEYLKARERNHRELSIRTFALVWKWTLAETIVLVGIASLQVAGMKTLFETTRLW